MGWYLYDVDGYVADFSTCSGLHAFADFIESTDASMLKEFVDNGAVLVTPELIEELDNLPLAKADKEVRSIIRDLKENARLCKNVIILGNGIGDND